MKERRTRMHVAVTLRMAPRNRRCPGVCLAQSAASPITSTSRPGTSGRGPAVAGSTSGATGISSGPGRELSRRQGQKCRGPLFQRHDVCDPVACLPACIEKTTVHWPVFQAPSQVHTPVSVSGCVPLPSFPPQDVGSRDQDQFVPSRT